jgi:paraquat-inducible protein B
MSKPANKTMIGIFVVAAIGLVVVAIVLLGSGKFFKDKPKFVMYFEGSVKGLTVGSPVVFRGVKIGSVTEIGMRFNPTDLSVLIPVYTELGDADIEMVGGDLSIKKKDRKKSTLFTERRADQTRGQGPA